MFLYKKTRQKQKLVANGILKEGRWYGVLTNLQVRFLVYLKPNITTKTMWYRNRQTNKRVGLNKECHITKEIE